MANNNIHRLGALLAAGTLSTQISAQDAYSVGLVPQSYRTVTEMIVVQEASERRVTLPAQFNTLTETYLTVEAHCPGEQLVRQTRTIEVEPAYTKTEQVAGEYETVTEEVIVRPGTTEWRATPNGSFEFITTEPDVRTVTRRVQTKAPSERRITIPARSRTLVTQVRPADAGPLDCVQVVPARVEQVTRRIVIKPEETREISIPAQTRTITRRVSDGHTLTATSQSGGPAASFSMEADGPTNPVPDTLYKPEVRNANCVLWKSFSKETAPIEKGRFPWPPPNPSTESTLPDGMFAGVETLGDMNQRLITALDALGYQDRRRKYYPVPYGFALVTEIEQIDDSGRPLSGTARWTDDIYVVDPPSILGWLKALVTKATGRFRVFALIVTSEDVNTEGAFDDRDIALDWLNSGTGALNRDRAACEFTASHRVTALVYEFEHPERQEPYLVSNTLINHIAGSGLRAQLAKVGAAQ